MKNWITCCALALVGACATMDESECLTADWRMVGLEDGTKGLATAQIGEYREACAEHGVTPDLAAYRSGHEEGLRSYCTPESGYAVGSRGSRYRGVCPDDLEEGFLLGYEQGRELIQKAQEVRRLEQAVAKVRANIQQDQTAMGAAEEDLVSGEGDEESRRELLAKVKSFKEESEQLRKELRALEAELKWARQTHQSLLDRGLVR